MTRHILFIFFSLITLTGQSQTDVILELGEFMNRPCVADSSTSVIHPEFWIAYATIDDQLGSPKDPSICVDWSQDQIIINGLSSNSRPIFIEYIGEEKRLEANSSYSIERVQGDQFGNTPTAVAQYAISLMYESAGVLRELLIDQFDTDFTNLYSSSSCVITEYMEDPLISSYVSVVDSDILSQLYLTSGFDGFPSTGFYQFPAVVSEVLEVRSSNTTLNTFFPSNTSTFQPTLLAFRNSGVPSQTNIDTFFVREAYDPSGPDTVSLLIFSENEVLIPPFVDIAFENTADPNISPPFEIRYRVDFCLPFQLVERPVAPGNGIVFDGGQPLFGHETACIMLNESSYLEVGKQQRLWYGQNSVGMLAMKSDASIVLEANSEVLFDGTLALGLAANESAKISIGPGAHLEFSESSIITHLRNLAPAGQIEVELTGGTIDLTALNDEERRFFQITAEENVRYAEGDFLTIWHQPNASRLTLTPTKAIDGLTVNVYSLAGQLLTSQNMADLQENESTRIALPNNSPPSLKAVQFITERGEQQTLTLLF